MERDNNSNEETLKPFTAETIKDESALMLLGYMAERVKVEREKSGKEKSDTTVPMRYLDTDERYHKVEEAVCANSRTPPSVARFIACCMSLQSGFKAARMGQVDFDLAKRKWLAACLRMMCMSVLKVPQNDWKLSLSVPDGQLIHRFFTQAAEEMMNWVRALQDAEPDADFYMFGPLAEAIHRCIISEHLIDVDGKRKVAIEESIIVKTMTVTGNLVVNDMVIGALLNACTEVNAFYEYQEGPCPSACKLNVEIGQIGMEFDHTWRCLESNMKLMECWTKLYERYAKYEEVLKTGGSVEIRRELLTFEESDNCWFDFYVREYCTPTPYHLMFADEEWIDKKQLMENFSYVEEITENMCKYVVMGNCESPESVKMYEQWKLLAAKFQLSCLNRATPSYAEQRSFCTELSSFMNDFASAVGKIGKPCEEIGRRPDAKPNGRNDLPTHQEKKPSGQEKIDWFNAMMNKMENQEAAHQQQNESLITLAAKIGKLEKAVLSNRDESKAVVKALQTLTANFYGLDDPNLAVNARSRTNKKLVEQALKLRRQLIAKGTPERQATTDACNSIETAMGLGNYKTNASFRDAVNTEVKKIKLQHGLHLPGNVSNGPTVDGDDGK